MADLGRSPSACAQTAALPNLVNVPNRRDKPHSAISISLFIAIVASVTVAIVLWSVFFLSRRDSAPTYQESQAFCCPQEAELMARYVNVTLDPCSDFFAYVCSNVIGRRLQGDVALPDSLKQMVVTGVLPEGVRRGKAAVFFIAFHRTCVEAIQHSNLFLADLSSALVSVTSDFLGKLNSRNALAYVFETNFKYLLHPEFVVQYEPEDLWLMMYPNPRCGSQPYSLEALSAVLRALKSVLSLAATAENLIQLRSTVCTLLQNDSETTVYTNAEFKGTFSREVWSIDDVSGSLKLLGLRDNDVTSISVYRGRVVKAMRDVFNADSYANADKAAYLLWGSIESGYELFYPSRKLSAVHEFETCGKILFDPDYFGVLWEVFSAEVLTTREKDQAASSLFATVKGAVHRDCQSSSLFEPEDVPKLEAFFRVISIVSPLAASHRSVDVATPTHRFAENFLLARENEFEIARQTSWGLLSSNVINYGPTRILDSRVFQLPPMLYGYINHTGSRSSDLPEMATLGRLVAESLWNFVLYGIEWSPKTTSNIQRLKSCFASSMVSATGVHVDALNTSVSVLGLSSVLNAFPRTDWLEEKIAWSLWTLSHAQLFYIMSTFERCLRTSTPNALRDVNAPLARLEDFANAFHCGARAAMVKHTPCKP